MTMLWIHGISGKMGKAVCQELEKQQAIALAGGSHSRSSDAEMIEGLTRASALLDFSNKEGNERLYKILQKATKAPKIILLASTGLADEALEQWQNYAVMNQAKILLAENTSLGIGALLKSALRIAPMLCANGFDIELTETHHRDKKDAPSGTAMFLAQSIAAHCGLTIAYPSREKRKPGTLGINWQRGGGVFGEHSIRFISSHEEIVLGHRAFSRQLFAEGALFMLRWLENESTGHFFRLATVYQIDA